MLHTHQFFSLLYWNFDDGEIVAEIAFQVLSEWNNWKLLITFLEFMNMMSIQFITLSISINNLILICFHSIEIFLVLTIYQILVKTSNYLTTLFNFIQNVKHEYKIIFMSWWMGNNKRLNVSLKRDYFASQKFNFGLN